MVQNGPVQVKIKMPTLKMFQKIHTLYHYRIQRYIITWFLVPGLVEASNYKLLQLNVLLVYLTAAEGVVVVGRFHDSTIDLLAQF